MFLASSRTSILGLTAGLLLRIYFDTTKINEKRSSHMENGFSKGYWRRRLTLRKILIGITSACFIAAASYQIIGSNTTGSGRLGNYRNTISNLSGNLLLGQGPSIFSINITENTILTLLSYYGLIGLALVLVIAFAFSLKYSKMPYIEKKPFVIALTTFLIAGIGDALLTGTSQDTGLFYLLVLLALTRVEQSSKDL
jgi:hypothetical protein